MSHENLDPTKVREAGTDLLRATQQALQALQAGWPREQVQDWCAHILSLKGRVVLTGMGKSGLIGQKIAATLASTGCPAFFMHPAEALHGDLGMVTAEDSVLALSNSGESEEIVRLLPSLLRMGMPLAALTSRTDSSLGRAARWCFTYELPEGEGCPLDLAPMASTTLQLVWGDLLAAALMKARGFTKEGFALNHPAGSLGAKLMKVKDLMHHEWPRVTEDQRLVDVLQAMTKGRLGMCTVDAPTGDLAGVITDGDIRRGLAKAQDLGRNPLDLTAADLCTRKAAVVRPEELALEAANRMEARRITFLVVEQGGKPLGVLHIHDLLGAKVL